MSNVMPVPRPNTTEPMLTIAFSESHPSPLLYVHTRRGMPSTPRMCIGKNVRLNPTNITQKLSLPNRSFNMRPVAFGYQ